MPAPPTAARRPHVHIEHGVPRDDPWHWLKDREDPATIAHLQAENAYTEAAGAHLAPLRDALYAEMLGRIQEDDASVPVSHGGFSYYRRTVEGRPYALHCRRPDAPAAEEQVIVDENELAAGHAYFRLEQVAISRDHRRAAWLQDTDGGERFALYVRDLDSGQTRLVATDLKWSIAWDAHGEAVFGTKADAAQRPFQAWRFPLHGEPALVAEEPDERFFVGVSRTRDWRFVIVEASSKTTSEISLIPADRPDTPPRIVWPRRQGVLYEIAHHHDRLVILANDAGANFRVVEVPDDDPSAVPVQVRPHDPDVYVTGVQVFRDHYALWERRDGMPAVTIRELATGAEHRVTFPEPAFDVGPEENPTFDTATLRMTYSSPRTPPTVFAYDMATRALTALKVHPVIGHDPDRYEVELIAATAADGQEIPISVLRLAGQSTDGGPYPMLLIGYGSYGLSYPASFRSSRLSLVDRGIVVAIAHVRGGSERGRWWYENGKLQHKVTTFTDFVDATEHLIRCGWTAPDRLAIQGGSAGGLLVGAALNRRPDLYAAAIANVPFVDALNTMLDATLPLTVTEYEEWGDPNDPSVFERLRGYAPYENVADADYPAVFVTAGLNDPRVGYWEPAKWVQKLRAHTTGDRPVLFRVHLGAGHGGQSGRYGQIEDLAWEYGFLLDRLPGVRPITP